MDDLADKISELEKEIQRRGKWHHPACRKLMYDLYSSPCTCEKEYCDEKRELISAREKIKDLELELNNAEMDAIHGESI